MTYPTGNQICDRIQRIVRDAGKVASETTLDLLWGLVLEYDVDQYDKAFDQITDAFSGNPSPLEERVWDAMSYTRQDGGSIFDWDGEL